ncbi:MAG TPA: hypothetical protein VFI06_06410 [Chitinophagaceae bacterium]|nr:hypothetical protein [Chitinophagaceae bacterium]
MRKIDFSRTQIIFLIIAAAHYIAAMAAAGGCISMGEKTHEFYTTGTDFHVIGGETGLNGAAMGLGIVGAALILSGTFFLYKVFQKDGMNK